MKPLKLIHILLFTFPLILLCHCSSQQTVDNEQSSKSDFSFPIIDAHTHTNFDNQPEASSAIPYSREQYLSDLRKAGVVGAVSHTSYNGGGYLDLKAHNVLHCAGIGKAIKIKQLDSDLRSGKFHCIKIYLGYVHKFAYSNFYRPVYKLAEKHDVPVVFHTGDTYTSKGKLKYSHPLTVDDVAVDFPNVKFVIAHLGNPWIRTAAEVAYKNPNVYVEASALLIGELAKKDPELIEELVVKPIRWAFQYIEDPNKFLFGTDWPLTHIGPYIEAYKKAIPKKYWKKVFYENAINVFPFKNLRTPRKLSLRGTK